MRTATYENLHFYLPDADVIFHKKLANYVREIGDAVTLLPERPTGTLVVVGACFGATAIGGIALAGFEKVVAFEPDPRNFEYLRRNLERNGMTDKVTVLRKAVGRYGGRATLVPGKETNIGGSNVVFVEEGGDVEVVGLDYELVGMDVAHEVGLVWCDAQGAEASILYGAEGILRRGHVPLGIELAPGLLKHPFGYCEPLAEWYTHVVDLREPKRVRPASDVSVLFEHYLRTLSPNKPVKSWHTQLLFWNEGEAKT